MKKIEAELKLIEEIASQTVKVELFVDNELLKTINPGQFVHIKIGTGSEFLLRRPISVCDVDLTKETLTLIFKIFGEGTQRLSQLTVGEKMDVLIPCGNGYQIDGEKGETVLLIGGGIGVPPLYYLGKKLKEQGLQVISVLGFQTKADVFYVSEFESLGETFVATDDGSYGIKGFVTDAIDQSVENFDTYYSCGPNPMLKAVEAKLLGKRGFISLEERMGCGIGACYACVVDMRDGETNKKICQEGPVFGANEVIL